MTKRRGPLAALLALVASLAAPDGVVANPVNGNVPSGGGSATIHYGTTTTIDQHSDRVILNWDSFDISHGETTQFIQPGSGAIALNRVTGGGGRSTIDGALMANGGVWLINPAGVLFGANAQVNVQSLLATSADILDADFMASSDGRFPFTTPSADANAAIVNQGTITLGEAGLGALVAPHVRNEGTITGQLATVVLAGARTFTIDFNGDGLLQFDATSTVAQAPAGADALVENTGTIRAPGGTVMLTADAAANVIDGVINSSGIIEATGVAVRDGRIVLDGGANGRVVVDGTLDVSPSEAGAEAGSIDIGGENVFLDQHALLDASQGGAISITAQDAIGINAPIQQTGDTDISLHGKTVVIRRPVETGGTVRITAKHARTEDSGIVTAERLSLLSNAAPHHPTDGGDAALATNVRELVIGKAGANNTHFASVTIDNQGNLIVGVIDDHAGIELGSIILTTSGTLTLDQQVIASHGGNAIVLSADRFVNQAGSAALQAPAGRWLVYSRDPTADVRGDLAGTLLFGLTFAGNPPASIATSGNAFLYAQSPPPPLPPPAPTQTPAQTPNLEPALAIATIPINTEPLTEVSAPPLASTQITVDPPRLIAVAPASGDEGDDPLFASDGNRELWDLSRGR